MDDLTSNLKAVIAEQLGVSIDMITSTANLKECSNFDKTCESALTAAIMQRFDISITDEDTAQFITTEDVFRYVETKLWWYSL